MKILAIIIAIIAFSTVVKSQSTTIVNDTILPYGDFQSQFNHVFKHDTVYFVEGFSSAKGSIPASKFFIKVGLSGNIIKKKHYSPSLIFPSGRYYNTIIETKVGFVNASTYRDSVFSQCIIMAIDYNLDTIWTSKIAPAYFSASAKGVFLTDIKRTPGNGYLACGYYEFRNADNTIYPFIVKTDSIGSVQWVKKFESPAYKYIKFRRLELTPDMGILLLTSDKNVLKTNALGGTLWETHIPNDSIYIQESDITFLASGEFIVACPYMVDYVPDGQNTGVLIKAISICSINYSTGQINWEKSHRPFKTLLGIASIQLHALGNKFAITTTARKIYNPIPNTNLNYRDHGVALYYNASGDSIGGNLYLSGNQLNSWLNYVLIEPNGVMTGVGFASGLNNVLSAGWIFRSNDYLSLGIDKPLEKHAKANGIRVYPNPATNIINIEFDNVQRGEMKIISITGEELISRSIDSNTYVSISTNSLAKGVYIVCFMPADGSGVIYSKLLVQ